MVLLDPEDGKKLWMDNWDNGDDENAKTTSDDDASVGVRLAPRRPMMSVDGEDRGS